MSARVLVAYASTHGHTARIADRVGAVLRESGVAAHVREVGTPGAHLLPAEFDGVVVGASVHMHHHQPAVVEWIAEHRTILDDCNLPTRVLMHSIAKRHEDHVDVHQDIDYTDWAAVERFATGFATALRGEPVS